MKVLISKVLKRLTNKYILASTIANIITILTLLGVIDVVKADTITKVVGFILLILVQVGIIKNPDSGSGEDGK
jgi:uncharacterized membrane protein